MCKDQGNICLKTLSQILGRQPGAEYHLKGTPFKPKSLALITPKTAAKIKTEQPSSANKL
jgi:hypothetical protein